MATTYLLTGGDGFIGSNFILYLLNSHNDIRLVDVALMLAGNLENLNSIKSTSGTSSYGLTYVMRRPWRRCSLGIGRTMS